MCLGKCPPAFFVPREMVLPTQPRDLERPRIILMVHLRPTPALLARLTRERSNEHSCCGTSDFEPVLSAEPTDGERPVVVVMVLLHVA